jgi:hypothetical protein
MGAEARCAARFDGRAGEGTALLESDALIFRGPFRFVIARGEVRAARADDGTLVITTDRGEAVLALGAKAAAWRDKLLNPKSVLDKLGVKSGARVAVLGVADAAFRADLAARDVREGDVARQGGADLVFLAADSKGALKPLRALKAAIAPDGAVWVVSRKGKQATIKDAEVMAAGKAAGLVDNKVVAFSATHTALRFVIPRADRKR